MNQVDLNFFSGKRVLLTGHTGFKGSWMSRVLINAGAELCGYSTCSPRKPGLYQLLELDRQMKSVKGDVRDFYSLSTVFSRFKPEIVIHMAAQPIVRTGYEKPLYTYETNVMGTVNILECVRNCPSVKSFLNVTTDKVYKNNEWIWGYRENEALDGYDPYSNSKSCSELVTHSYCGSFFKDSDVAISTARAGNVIGGGDFARDRIIPDCVRSVQNGTPIVVRNPYSIRPYQHVLEPVLAYLMIVQKQYENKSFEGWYNVGPDESDCISTGELVSLFCKMWGENAEWTYYPETNAVHEANFLKLDCSKLKSTFGWAPVWHVDEAIEKVCEWTKVYLIGKNLKEETDRQIKCFCKQADDKKL